MKKIKDFFYNKNDIIIVLLIVALAAFIIYTRVDAIMKYPEKMADKAETQSEQQQETKTDDAAKAPADKDSSGADAPADAADSDGKAADDADKASDISIKITAKDTSVTVSEKLADAGLVSSATEFEGYIANMGKEDSLKTGTFTIPTGSSNEEILDIITK